MFPSLLGYGTLGLVLVRVMLGLVFLYHGKGKLKKTKEMAKGMGMSAGMVSMLGFVEVAAGALLVVGLLTQLSALVVGVIMLGALYFKKFKWGKGSFKDLEFDLLLLLSALLILTNGAGMWALDGRFF